MKAVVVHEYGAPEVLKFEQYPDPVARTGEVLVRVAATSINPFDIMRRSGIAKEVAPIKFPGIVGVDLSGTVVAIGTEAGGFSIGDQVFGMADQTYAEFCAVKATNLEKIPEGLDLIDAAALPLVTTTGNTVALGDRASSNLKAHCGFDALSRKRWKKRWRHLYREFLEHAHRPRDVPVAQVNDRKIKDAEVPLRHDLDKAPVAH